MKTPNTSKDAKKLDHSCFAGENIKWYTHSGKQFGNSYKTNHAITIQPVSSPWAFIYPRELKTFVYTKSCTPMFLAAVFIINKDWNQPRCSLKDKYLNYGTSILWKTIGQ